MEPLHQLQAVSAVDAFQELELSPLFGAVNEAQVMEPLHPFQAVSAVDGGAWCD
jgi:hypothetical protein